MCLIQSDQSIAHIYIQKTYFLEGARAFLMYTKNIVDFN